MLRKTLSKIYYRLPAKFPHLGYAFPCRNVVFELTYNCNLDCKMCSYKNEIKHAKIRGSDFEPLTKDEIINLLHEFPKHSNVFFTGGEIFVKKGIMDILEVAAKLHRVSLATNGTLFTDEIAAKLVGWGVKSIGLSLDGPRDIHNKIRGDSESYDKLISAIKAINRYKKKLGAQIPWLTINGVILKENLAGLHKNLEVAASLNINACTFQVIDYSLNRSGWRLSNEINTAEKIIQQVEPIDREILMSELERLVAMGKKLNMPVSFAPPLTLGEVVDYYNNKFNANNWHCLEPWSTMRISPYGDVFPCLNFKIGNVREQKPAVLWNSPNYRKFRRQLGRLTLFDSCTGCCKPSKPGKPGFITA